jgi:hypothetical protein
MSHIINPFPSDAAKEKLCQQTHLNMKQISDCKQKEILQYTIL